jgi:hypothetical protein
MGHTGTAERPANAQNNRAPTRRSARESARFWFMALATQIREFCMPAGPMAYMVASLSFIRSAAAARADPGHDSTRGPASDHRGWRFCRRDRAGGFILLTVGVVGRVAMAQRPVTLADIVRGHVSLEIEGFDRLYFNGWVPALQTSGQIAG